MNKQSNDLLKYKLIPQLEAIRNAKLQPSTVTLNISYPTFQALFELLTHQKNNLRVQDLSETFNFFRKKMQITKEQILNMIKISFEDNSKAFKKILEDVYVSKGNQLCTLIQLENSLSMIREQLTKVTQLIENTLYAYSVPSKQAKHTDSKTASSFSIEQSALQATSLSTINQHKSKIMILLNPIQQFILSITQKVNSVEKEIQQTELGKGFPFSLIMKNKGELSKEEQVKREKLLANPAVNTKIAVCVKSASSATSSQITPTARNATHINVEENRPPSSASSCTMTELEDFLYNVLHGGKDDRAANRNVFNQDVSLKDLLAVSKPSMVASPIATSTGCLKDIDAVALKPEEEFDKKKIKKIEFSDDKLKDNLPKEIQCENVLSAVQEIEKLALNTNIRKQPLDNVMKYKDYAKMCKKGKKGGLNEMLGSDLMSSQSFMSSFDIPDEMQESYGSLQSNKDNEKAHKKYKVVYSACNEVRQLGKKELKNLKSDWDGPRKLKDLANSSSSKISSGPDVASLRSTKGMPKAIQETMPPSPHNGETILHFQAKLQ